MTPAPDPIRVGPAQPHEPQFRRHERRCNLCGMRHRSDYNCQTAGVSAGEPQFGAHPRHDAPLTGYDPGSGKLVITSKTPTGDGLAVEPKPQPAGEVRAEVRRIVHEFVVSLGKTVVAVWGSAAAADNTVDAINAALASATAAKDDELESMLVQHMRVEQLPGEDRTSAILRTAAELAAERAKLRNVEDLAETMARSIEFSHGLVYIDPANCTICQSVAAYRREYPKEDHPHA